ncbi:hypothetical protein H0H87_012530 [Tephrocybe sp. NHM501043]|nr:hypothetical protein H0H87_012530 [Tephrocybe sp. NHM501043]
MDDSSVSDAHENDLASSVVSILGIKDGLRFRAHGSTQKAHLVLRRVNVFDESSNGGLGGNVVRFTLIAHKRIEVKPGKELLLMLEPNDGPFKDRPIVMEGDIKSPEDVSKTEERTIQSPAKEEVYVPPIEEAIPPKMRRTWTRKTEESRKPSTSVGTQTEPLDTSISTQVQISCRNASSQASTSFQSVSVQVEPSLPVWTSTAVQTQIPPKGDVSMGDQIERVPVNVDRKSVGGGRIPNGDKKERSLSPMELDSPPDSPRLVPLSTSSIASATVPQRRLLSIRSPTYSPAAYSPATSIASSSGVQDMQMSPIELQSTGNVLISTRPPSPSVNSSHVNGIKDTTPIITQQSASGISSAARLPPPMDAEPATKPALRSARPTFSNPFVSGGFVTDFVALEKSGGSTVKVKTEDDDDKPFGKPACVKSEVKPSPQSTSKLVTNTQLAKPSAAYLPTLVQNAVASSSKLATAPAQLPQPVHSMCVLSGRALEKSPATISNETQIDSHKSSPPDPKPLAYILSGPTLNPLGIHPSSGTNILNVTKMPPSVPKALASSTSTSAPTPAKKCLVVGAEWKPFVKASNSTGPANDPSTTIPPAAPLSTPAVTVNSTLSQIVPYKSISPSPTAPPLSALHNRWKRVTSDVSPSPVTVSTSAPVAPCPPKAEATQTNGKLIPQLQKPTLLEKAQAPSLKDRIAPINTSIDPAPAKTNDADLLSRISGVSNSSLRTTPSAATPSSATDSVTASSKSTFVSRSPVFELAIPPTPSQSSPVISKSISQILTHPLPPKPSLSVLGIKRERSKSPEPISRKRQKRIFRWPTVDSNFSTRLIGDGQLGVRNIAFCSDGSHFALSCNDRTIRIWNSRTRTEIARLTHNSPLVAVDWIDGDSGVISLAEDGLEQGVNHWQWAKVLDAGKTDWRGDEDQICLAYLRDRIAVSYPRTGVKVWIWSKGIRRPNNHGAVEQSFSCKETEARSAQAGSFGAVFATEGQAVLFGSVEGCVLVWDRKKAAIVYGLEHEEDDSIQAVASFNGPTNRDGYLVTGTKSGQLSWWSQPVAAPQ